MFDATLLVEFEAVLIFKLAGTKGLLLDVYMKFYVKKAQKISTTTINVSFFPVLKIVLVTNKT